MAGWEVQLSCQRLLCSLGSRLICGQDDTTHGGHGGTTRAGHDNMYMTGKLGNKPPCLY